MKKLYFAVALLLALSTSVLASDNFISVTVHMNDGNQAASGVTIQKVVVNNTATETETGISVGTANTGVFPTCTGSQPYIKFTSTDNNFWTASATAGQYTNAVAGTGTTINGNVTDTVKAYVFGGSGCPANTPFDINGVLQYTQ